MTVSVEEYISKRAKTLTQLFLTRRRDILLTELDDTDVGIDVIAQIVSEEDPAEPRAGFGVVIKGTDHRLESEQEASKYANRLWRDRKITPKVLFPLLAFLFSTADDQGYCAWLIEPEISEENNHPSLHPNDRPEFRKLTKQTLDEIVDRVKSWSQALAAILLDHVTNASGR